MPMLQPNMNSYQDAIGKHAMSKLPTADVGVAQVHQTLINNAPITIAQNIDTKNMGNPTAVRLFITVGAACNFQVWVGNAANPGKLYHDVAQDITIGAAGDKVLDIKSGGIVRLIPSANVTATIETLALYY